eukprot:g9285.t1
MSTVMSVSRFEGLKLSAGGSSSRDRPFQIDRSSFLVEAKKADTFATRREKRHQRIRKTLSGTTERPRLSVYRSNKHIYAQVIDDTQSHTLCSASTLMKQVIEETDGKGADKKAAYIVGKLVGERALERGITQVCFDRGGYLYHGRIKVNPNNLFVSHSLL